MMDLRQILRLTNAQEEESSRAQDAAVRELERLIDRAKLTRAAVLTGQSGDVKATVLVDLAISVRREIDNMVRAAGVAGALSAALAGSPKNEEV